MEPLSGLLAESTAHGLLLIHPWRIKCDTRVRPVGHETRHHR